MSKSKIQSWSALSAQINPLEDIAAVILRARSETRESRHLEWKSNPPLGPTVSVRSKYRMVKAAISFANTDGGFILFGIDSSGKWVGLDKKELNQVDPAHVIELINGCVFPEILILNFADFLYENRSFAVLHIPPSSIAPHVTTKDISEKDEFGKPKTIILKHVVYSRQGAKSDLATPHQHQRMVEKRIEHLKSDLVRRVKEVTIPVVGTASSSGKSGEASITVARLSKDPNAPAVRLTRSRDGVAGTLLHEELSDGLFEEINNVIDASLLLSKGQSNKGFYFVEQIYYRVYAERHHVEETNDRLTLLLKAGLIDSYSPFLFWCRKLPAKEIADCMRSASVELKEPQIRGLIRLAILLGPACIEWLWRIIEKHWGKSPQPPDYFWSFKEQRNKQVLDSRLGALRITGRSSIKLPGSQMITADTLLADAMETSNQLTRACVEVSTGNKDMKTTVRTLDILAYGMEISKLGKQVEKLLVQ